MTTIINTPSSTDTGSGGFAVAIIVLLAVIIGGYFLLKTRVPADTTPTKADTINVTLPTPAVYAPASPTPKVNP